MVSFIVYLSKLRNFEKYLIPWQHYWGQTCFVNMKYKAPIVWTEYKICNIDVDKESCCQMIVPFLHWIKSQREGTPFVWLS